MGHRGPPHLPDPCKLYNEDSFHTLCSVFEHEWEKQQNYNKRLDQEEDSGRESVLVSSKINPGYSLLYALWMTFRPALVKVVLLRLSTDLFSILVPLTLRWVILYCERQAVFDWTRYTYSLVVLGAVCCCAVSQHRFEKKRRIITANAQAVLTGIFYRKTLSLSHSSQQQPNITQETNVLAEVDRVAELVVTLACLWSSPLRVALYLGLLLTELGLGVLVGVALLLVLIPVNSAVERKAKQIRKTQRTVRERSEQLIKEMLHKYQTLKLLTWESWFHQRVTDSRTRELETLRVQGYLTAFSMLDSVCLPFLVVFSSLAVFVLMDDGNVLTSPQIFTSLCFFRLLRPPLLELPGVLCVLKQAQQSLCHLENIFLTEDLDNSQLVTTKDDTEDLQPYASQQSCERCEDKHSNADEEREHYLFPKVSKEARRLYLRAFGWHWLSVSSLVFLSVCAVGLAQDGVLSMWTGEAKEVQGLEGWKELRNSRLSAYALLGLLQAVLVCCAAYCLTCASLRASRTLHSELLSDALHLPVLSQKTDTRRLLRAFTQVLDVVDEELPSHLHSFLRSLLDVLSTIALIGFIMPVFGLAVFPLIILFLRIQSRISSAHMLMRHMEAKIVVSVTSSLRCEPKHREVCLTHGLQALNQNLLLQYNKINTESWAAFQCDGVSGIGLFLVSLLVLETQPDSGLMALALIGSFSIKEALRHYPPAASDVNTDMMSLQNLCDFAKVEREAAWTVAYRPPLDWPQHGEVMFRNYESETSPTCTTALRGINLTILKGEKIGIVSRLKADTDAVVSSLFRSAEARSGAVLIDNINIARVGLHDLRNRLQLIPQAPVLFSGPLRANLDPFSRHSDAQVWLSLEICHLKQSVQQLPAQLLHPVHRSALADSVGQRRLLCLARALLARVRILLVEDPLPSTDPETEDLLRRLIQAELKDQTVLWLAQTPLSVTHTDRLLVLNEGRVVKFDAPSVLLQQGPLFSQ